MVDSFQNDEILFLKGKTDSISDGQSRDQLLLALRPFGLDAFVTSRFKLVEAEIKKLILDKGVSFVWQLVKLQESLLSRTKNLPALVAVLRGMMEKLDPKRDFIVIDRYLIPNHIKPGYLDVLVSVLEPITTRVEQITFITSQEYSAETLVELQKRLKAATPACKVAHRTSDAFHDRFWIADRERGLFVGASLNGIGLRYALADYMNSRDVGDIVKTLKQERLV